MEWLFERLKEPSTYRGLTALAGAFGLVVSPEQATAIMTVVLMVIGLIGAGSQDK